MGKDWLILDIRDRKEIEEEVDHIVNTISIVATGEEIDPIDIDNIKDAKVYKFDDTSLAKTSYNLPEGVKGSFKLTVSNGNNKEAAIQSLFAYEPNSTWQRNWEVDHWTDWNKVITTEDALKIVDDYRGLSEENQERIDNLEATKADKTEVEQQIKDTVTQIVAGAEEDFDTLKEIADWINGHGKDAAEMNSQIQQNKSDIQNLTQELAQTEGDLEDLEARVTVNEGDIDSLQAKDEEIQDDISAFKTEVQNTYVTNQNFNITVQELRDKDQELQKQIDERKEEDKTQNQRLDSLEQKDQEHDKEIADLKSEDQYLEEEIQGLKDKDDEIDQEIQNLKDKDTQIDSEIEKLKEKDQQHDEKIKQVEDKNTEQDGRLTTVESKNAEQDNRLTEIESKNTQQDSRLDATEKENESQNEKLDSIEKENTKQNDRLDSIENEDTQQNERLTQIEEKDNKQDSQITAIQEKDKEQDSEIESLQQEDQKINEEIEKLKQTDTEQDDRLSAIETKDGEQDSKLKSIEDKNTEQDEKLAELESKNNEQDGKLDDLAAKDKSIDGEIDKLKAEDTKQNQDIDSLESAVEGLGTRDQELQTEINNFKNEYNTEINSLKQMDSQQNTQITNIENKLENVEEGATKNIPSDEPPKPPAAQASPGTKEEYSRGDHVHPLQTEISGNAGTASKLETGRDITLEGDISGSVNFDGSSDVIITTELSNTGVSGGSYGPSKGGSLSHSGTFTVPSVTVDEKGRVTKISTQTFTLPTDNDTKYSAGTGLSLTGTTFANTGVLSVATGTSNGSISVNTGGTTKDVAVKGLGSAAYTDSNAYATKSHTHSASDINSGTLAAERLPNIPSEKLTGKIPSTLLPEYVDDVIEGYFSSDKFYEDSSHAKEITGEKGKIYTDLSTNKIYRWSGSKFTVISETLALGTTSSTAFRGDQGKIAYDHANAKGIAAADGLYKITTNDQGHVIKATKVTKTDITALGIPGTDTNTDTKVNVTLGTTTKAYLLGTSTTPTATAAAVTAIADTGVFLDTVAGTLTATTFKGNLSGNATTATTATYLGVDDVGSATQPIYLNSGVVTESDATVGTADTPVYLNKGIITSTGKKFSSYLPLTGGTVTGNLTVNGTITGTALKGPLTGNASSATKLQTGRTIVTNLGSTTAATFTGESNIEPGIKGTLGVAHGGTGKTSWTANQLVYSSSTTALANTANITYIPNKDVTVQSVTVKQNGIRIYGATYGNDNTQLLSNTKGVFTYGDGGPQIQFSISANVAQDGALIFTDNDQAGTGASFHFVSNQTDWNVNSKRFVAKSSVTVGSNLPNTSYNLYVNGTTYLAGKSKIINTTADNTNVNSSHLVIGTSADANGSGGTVGLELYRGKNSSWQIVNDSGTLHFKNNYTDAVQTTYSLNMLSIAYNTGNATFKGTVTAPTFSGALNGNASTATKLGTATKGTTTNPIYLNAGAPTACTGRTVPGIKSATSATHLGWGTNNTYVPDITMLAYWNGRYNDGSSNLTYCVNGTIVGTTGNQTIGGTKTFSSSIVLSGTAQHINYSSTTRNGAAISFYNGDANGSGVVIGAGGRTIIGGGEAAENLRGALGTATTNESSEELHLANDGPVKIHTNCQTIASRKTFIFDNSGNLTVPGTVTATTFSGNATSATKLQTARAINGVSFNGTANITIPRSTMHIHTAQGTSGTTGWVKVAEITITNSYANHPIRIVFAQRGRLQSTLHIVFSNSGTTTTTISQFRIDSPDTSTTSPKLVNSGTVWSLWIQKAEGYDHIYITDFTKADGAEGSNYTIKWTDVHSNTDPGGTAATRACGTAIVSQVLETKRNLLVSLGSTAKGAFNGSADVDIGVKGTLAVNNGGTGAGTFSTNAILCGNGTSMLKSVSTAKGAFYATAANGAPQFGTLPVAEGGTGATTLTSGAVLIGNGTGAIQTRAIKNITAKDSLSWSSTVGTQIPTLNTLAYWNGAYSSSTSNLTYCSNGTIVGTSTASLGNTTTPVYLKENKITACSNTFVHHTAVTADYLSTTAFSGLPAKVTVSTTQKVVLIILMDSSNYHYSTIAFKPSTGTCLCSITLNDGTHATFGFDTNGTCQITQTYSSKLRFKYVMGLSW